MKIKVYYFNYPDKKDQFFNCFIITFNPIYNSINKANSRRRNSLLTPVFNVIMRVRAP